MKVSNGINVTRIYQEQLKKAQNKTTNDSFSKMLGNVTGESTKVSNASALKQNYNSEKNIDEQDVKEFLEITKEALENLIDIVFNPYIYLCFNIPFTPLSKCS